MPRGIFSSQQRYIRKLLEKFQMQHLKPISLPMDPNTKLTIPLVMLMQACIGSSLVHSSGCCAHALW